MYQRPVPNPYRDIEPTGNIFTDARKQFVQLFGGAPSSFSSFNPITRAYGEGGYHQHKDRFGQLFEEMQADLAEGMDLQQIREKYSQTPEARAYLNFQANYDPATFAEDNPDLAERGTMNAKQAWTAALFTDKIDYNEPGGGFYQEQAEKFLAEGDDGRTPATIREYRDREKDDYLSQGGTLQGFMRREPIDPVAVQEREEARRASMTPERRLREDIQSGRVSLEEAQEQYPDQFRQAQEMARQDRAGRRAEGGIGSLRDRMRERYADRFQQMRDRSPSRRMPGPDTPQDPNLIVPDSAYNAGGFGTVDFGDEARAKMPIDYSAADIGGGRPAPVATTGGTLDYGQPGFSDPAQPFNLPSRTPPGFRPVTDPGYYKPSTGQSLLGSGIAGTNLYRDMIGTGPVDPMRAITDPYYRFTPATPPVAATLPPTPASPNVAGNVLSEMPGAVGPITPTTPMPIPGGLPTGMSPGEASLSLGQGRMSPGQLPIPYTPPVPTQGQFPLGLGNGSQFLPTGGMEGDIGGRTSPGKGGMSPGQTYQPYTPAGSGFGGYGGGMGGGKGGTQPRPASGGKGGAQYMGTPPSYSPYA